MSKYLKKQPKGQDFGGRRVIKNAVLVNCTAEGGSIGPGSGGDAIKYTEQSLTDLQKSQARTNIGAGSAADVTANATAIAAETGRAVAAEGALQQAIAAVDRGVYREAWDGSSTPVVANIPAGVVVTYNGTDYTGTLAASADNTGEIYLVSDGNGGFDRYTSSATAPDTFTWVNLGNTDVPLADYATDAELSQLEQEVGDMSQFEYSAYQDVTLTNKKTGYYFNFQRLEEVESSAYEYAIIDVAEGEKYNISGFNVNSNIPLAFVLNSSTSAKARAIYQSAGGAMSGEYTIPAGYDKLYVNGKTSGSPVSVQKWTTLSPSAADLLAAEKANGATKTELAQSLPLHVAVVEGNFYVAGSDSVKGIKVYVGMRYNDSYDVVMDIGNKSGSVNKFFDFHHVYKVTRGVNGVSDVYSGAGLTYLLGHDTDYILPIRVTAVNNANGDFPDETNYFTGGAHAYGNATSGDISQTMREASRSIRLDGKELSAGDSLYGRVLEMDVLNYVQGANTEKEDGTGREIITQHIYIKIDERRRAEVTVEWTALEDVLVNTLHCFGAYLDLDNYRFIGSSSKMNTYAVSSVQVPTDERINAIRLISAADMFEVGMDKTYGLGDGRYRDGVRNAYTTSANKGYFNVLKDDGTAIALSAGDMVTYRGYFQMIAV